MRATDASGPETRENLYITRAPAPTITPQLMSVFRHRLPMSVCLGLPSEITQPVRPFDCQFYAREVRSERDPRERKLLPGLGGDNALEVPTSLGGDKPLTFLSNGDSGCESTSRPPRPRAHSVDVTAALRLAEARSPNQPDSHYSPCTSSLPPPTLL